MKFYICLFIVAFYSFSYSQQQYFVSVNGNDSNNGDINAPFRKISKALVVALPGDFVYVRGGIYRNLDYNDNDIWEGSSVETITANGASNAYITIKPYQNETVIFEFDANYGIFINNSSYITFEGFIIKGIGDNITYTEAQNAWGLYKIDGVTYNIVDNENLLPLPNTAKKPSYYNGRGLVANTSHHINLLNNIIYNCTSSGLRVQKSDYVNVVNNHIYNNTYWTTQGVGALTVAEATNIDTVNDYKIILERNLVHDNENKMISWNPTKSFITYVIDEGSGIFLTRNQNTYLSGKYKISNNISYNNGASGIMCHFTNNALITNNTLFKNGTNNDGLAGGIGINNTENVIIANNIIYARPTKWALGTTAQPNTNYIVTNNIIYNENSTQSVFNNLDTGWTNVNPMFINESLYDFNLSSNSVAINSASSIYGEGFDFYNNPRNDGFVDIGAFEFNSQILSSTNQWTGTTDNDWNTASNWSLNTVPNAQSVISIPSTTNLPEISTSVIVSDLTVTSSLTVMPSGVLKVNGNITNNGQIIFKSNATGTGSFDTFTGTISGSGSVQAERYIPANKRSFRFLSPSVTTSTSINANWQEAGSTAAGLGTHITGNGGAANGFDTTTTNNPSLFDFDNANGTWSAVTNTNVNTLTAGTPYRLMVRGDRTVDMSTNTPTPIVTTLRASGALKTGDFTPTLNQAADGYSFIGNPYQAPVNIKTVLAAATDVNNAVVYYWDPTLNVRGGWVARNLTANTNDVTSSFNEFIQPNQAVFIKNSSSVTAPALTFTETDKAIANAAAGVFKTNNNTALLRLKLTASIDNQIQEIDGALVLFNEDYSWDVTQDDITKMGNLDEQVSFKVNNTELAIASQNNPIANAVLPISFTKNRQENYQWEFELENYNGLTPYLFDALTQSYTQIENGTNVAFTTANQDAEAIANRFTVVFQANLSTTDYLQNIALYPNPAKANQTEFILQGVDANSSVTMFNLLGQQIPVGVEALENSLRVTPKTSLSKGVYLVTIKTNQGSTSIKWIIE